MKQIKDKYTAEDLPSTEQLEDELDRYVYSKRFKVALRSTIYTVITVFVIAILVAVLLLPVLRIYGPGMRPTLAEKDIVISLKSNDFKRGDIISFYYNNKILVKRVIAMAGDVVDIGTDGTVLVNSEKLDEPYVEQKMMGECNIKFPYLVPEHRIFVLGDNRKDSIDSRNTAVGCVSEEQVVGKIVFRIWPYERLGILQKTQSNQRSSGDSGE